MTRFVPCAPFRPSAVTSLQTKATRKASCKYPNSALRALCALRTVRALRALRALCKYPTSALSAVACRCVPICSTILVFTAHVHTCTSTVSTVTPPHPNPHPTQHTHTHACMHSRTHARMHAHMRVYGHRVPLDVNIATPDLSRAVPKGHYRAPPRPQWGRQWGRSIHVSPQ